MLPAAALLALAGVLGTEWAGRGLLLSAAGGGGTSDSGTGSKLELTNGFLTGDKALRGGPGGGASSKTARDNP